MIKGSPRPAACVTPSSAELHRRCGVDENALKPESVLSRQSRDLSRPSAPILTFARQLVHDWRASFFADGRRPLVLSSSFLIWFCGQLSDGGSNRRYKPISSPGRRTRDMHFDIFAALNGAALIRAGLPWREALALSYARETASKRDNNVTRICSPGKAED
jgi:hypothetical protein